MLISDLVLYMNNDQQELDLNEAENDFVSNLNYIKEKLTSINLNDFDMRTSANRVPNLRLNDIKRLLPEIDKIIPFYRKYTNLFKNNYLGDRIVEKVQELKLKLSENDNFQEIFEEVGVLARRINDLFLRFKSQILFDTIEDELNNAKNEVINIKAAKLAIEANATDEIYQQLSEKYEEEYELNNEYFRNALIVTICCTILSIAYTFNTPIADINWAVFISVKLLILAVGITLCTLFLRRSAHAKKLHEKAYQTHVEINAYPLFIRSLEKSDQQEITKELALRYFGNDIDQTQNDKIGDLVQDQLSAGTELIRASAEMVKSKNGKGDEE